ncbi:hypothetical protein R1flu_024645 [Riccia fluitans]|uniref:Uncharacterized protein n=1 Tax=Riccia fluitans TaxID=41844 RepID=A0ABD1XVH1_9MARC
MTTIIVHTCCKDCSEVWDSYPPPVAADQLRLDDIPEFQYHLYPSQLPSYRRFRCSHVQGDVRQVRVTLLRFRGHDPQHVFTTVLNEHSTIRSMEALFGEQFRIGLSPK